MREVIVIKRDLQGQETWRYRGSILQVCPNFIRLEAAFNRPDTPFFGILLGQGDRFVETFYTDRWYNIFEIHDRQDDSLKGWYCNIAYPAIIQESTISYIDLALDLLVYPDGRQLVLDEDEFYALPLSDQDRKHACAALAELQEADGLFIR
jgi:hypothetical protein